MLAPTGNGPPFPRVISWCTTVPISSTRSSRALMESERMEESADLESLQITIAHGGVHGRLSVFLILFFNLGRMWPPCGHFVLECELPLCHLVGHCVLECVLDVLF